MLLTLDNDKIFINNIILCEPINNTVIENSKFIRLIYSDNNIIMNGIYIKVSMIINNIEHAYNKLRCNICHNENKIIINTLNNIEKNILNKYNSSKKPSYKLTECLNKGIIKIFTENYVKTNHRNILNDANNNHKKNLNINKSINQNVKYDIILKVSGIWVDNREFGLTYKFITI